MANWVADGSVVGVDNSEPMIHLAQENYPPNIHPNLSFQVMDATELSFENCFDVVFSNAVLHWVKHHQFVMHGLHKGLRTGGKILLSMGGQGGAEGIVSVLDELKASGKWAQFFTSFEFPFTFPNVEDYEALLHSAGFTIQRLELVPKAMMHVGFAGLESWIRTTWLPYTQRIPAEHRDEFIQAVTASYLARTSLTAEGNAQVAMVRLEVAATKIA